MAYRIVRTSDPGSFLLRAEAWLLAREAENNLILGIARSLAAGGDWYEPPLYLATVEGNDSVVGVAFRTPPYKLGLTRMPVGAVPAVAEDVAKVYDELHTALGPVDVVRRFGDLWAARMGCIAKDGMPQRIYELTEVIAPADPPYGAMRPAGPWDAPLLTEWGHSFHEDTGIVGGDTELLIRDLIEGDQLFVWEDHGPAAMAASMGQTPNGARIGYVYTPPHRRRRGYAAAVTAALSQRLLDGGRRFCCLYTDASAATPNRVYQRIGYRHVVDVADVDFV